MSNIFDAVKKDNEALKAINIQVPEDLKDDFHKVCKFNGVTMTSVIVKFIEQVVYDAKVENTNYEEDLIRFD